jgi:hypothetical protein
VNKGEKLSMGHVTNLFEMSASWSEVAAFFAVAICEVVLEHRGLMVERYIHILLFPLGY